MNWPNDADGGVLRRLQADGFDFSRPCVIDCNVDFEQWSRLSGLSGVMGASRSTLRKSAMPVICRFRWWRL